MVRKNNTTCAICGKAYHMCVSCKDLMRLNPWQIHTDTSEHFKIYQILHGYSTSVYTKDEAKFKLQKVDLSDFDNLRDNIKNLINEIIGVNVQEMNENPNVKNLKTKKSSKVVETE